ncbi:hypothetical protein MWU49_17160 [Alcanivorax sp. S6407]|uniref:hypothetical protein n=1 Tax=Alcanivorax sp. S6407 TaxID=2926424 RepID=UPI001FF60395|nr:hypothetical protein [Alcanivorax sp. S6407]MCK0155448.1 hypothetical protein [Alcanivorax sp. S6407]
MGMEILVVLILVPIALWVFDLVRIVQRKKALVHAILFLIGLSVLGYLALSSYQGGWHPMQGIVFGSLLYGPGYVVAWFILSVIFKVKNGNGESGGIT